MSTKPDGGVAYVSQGKLDVPEAEWILPRLEREKIRFQIETRLVKRRTSTNLAPVDRVELYIPPADLEAWGRIRAEFFPV